MVIAAVGFLSWVRAVVPKTSVSVTTKDTKSTKGLILGTGILFTTEYTENIEAMGFRCTRSSASGSGSCFLCDLFALCGEIRNMSTSVCKRKLRNHLMVNLHDLYFKIL